MWSRRAFVAGCARASRAYVPIATLATSSRNAPPSSNWPTLVAAGLGSSAFLGYLHLSDRITQPQADEVAFSLATLASRGFSLLDGETAHVVAVKLGALGLLPREHRPDPAILQTAVWGRSFLNPIGLAAGFDKNAECIDGMLAMGFGFVEIGSVTPEPQPGNPKPRVFRVPASAAIINRYGFNSEGGEMAERRLKHRVDRGAHAAGGILGVNLGKNKTSEDATADYTQGVFRLAEFADYLVVNISSPNTPGLRALQSKASLVELIRNVRRARDSMDWSLYKAGPPPVLVKIAPDLTEQDKRDIAAVALAERVDGLIVSNTTLERPPDVRANMQGEEQAGGLSGAPLMDPSTQVLREMYALTRGKVPLVGCGGISSGKDAYAKIRAGASLVQLYTALVYQGPGLLPRMKRELAECLREDGYATVEDAVGADHAPFKRRGWFGWLR